MIPPRPRRWARSASRTSSSTEVWYTPGRVGTSRRTGQAARRRDGAGAGRVLERRERRPDGPVAGPDLEAQRALPGRRHDLERVEPLRDPVGEPEPLETRRREQRRVEPVTPFLHL